VYGSALSTYNDPRYRYCLAHSTKSCLKLYNQLRSKYLQACFLAKGLIPKDSGNGPGENASASLAAITFKTMLGEPATSVSWLGADGAGDPEHLGLQPVVLLGVTIVL